jgi:hypothetical protein
MLQGPDPAPLKQGVLLGKVHVRNAKEHVLVLAEPLLCPSAFSPAMSSSSSSVHRLARRFKRIVYAPRPFWRMPAGWHMENPERPVRCHPLMTFSIAVHRPSPDQDGLWPSFSWARQLLPSTAFGMRPSCHFTALWVLLHSQPNGKCPYIRSGLH